MWSTAKKLIISLKLKPEGYSDNKKQFYRYFTANEYSLDYCKKVLRVINLYGKFIGRLTGKYFEPIPAPKGHDRELIQDAYHDSSTYYGPSEAITPEILMILKDKLPVEQFNWVSISVWFGLRPSEVDSLLEGDKTAWRVEEGDVDILWVYQPKLTSKPRPKRWKPIPVLYPEQMNALEVLRGGQFSRPFSKVLKKQTGLQCTLYGGRKGFVDLMLDRGQGLENIAQWLGHTTIEMTWSHYKDRSRVGYSKPG